MAEILRVASAEMAEAAAWYDERVGGLGDRFLTEVLEPRLVVVAVAHARRRPGYWATRLTGL